MIWGLVAAARHRSDGRPTTGLSGVVCTQTYTHQNPRACAYDFGIAHAHACDLSAFVCLMKLCMRLFIGIVLCAYCKHIHTHTHARSMFFMNAHSGLGCISAVMLGFMVVGGHGMRLIRKRKFPATHANVFSAHTRAAAVCVCVCVCIAHMRVYACIRAHDDYGYLLCVYARARTQSQRVTGTISMFIFIIYYFVRSLKTTTTTTTRYVCVCACV